MFEKYEATKLSKGDKRGLVPGSRSAREFHADKRGTAIGPVHPRPAEELATARLRLAEMALDQPDPEEWLRDVLGYLGLLEGVK